MFKDKAKQETTDNLSPIIEKKVERKLRAKTEEKSLWFGLGMFGLVGWAVAIPTLMGIGLGVWIDRKFPSRFSWTLMLLVVGIAVGCWNAWQWLQQEHDDD